MPYKWHQIVQQQTSPQTLTVPNRSKWIAHKIRHLPEMQWLSQLKLPFRMCCRRIFAIDLLFFRLDTCTAKSNSGVWCSVVSFYCPHLFNRTQISYSYQFHKFVEKTQLIHVGGTKHCFIHNYCSIFNWPSTISNTIFLNFLLNFVTLKLPNSFILVQRHICNKTKRGEMCTNHNIHGLQTAMNNEHQAIY